MTAFVTVWLSLFLYSAHSCHRYWTEEVCFAACQSRSRLNIIKLEIQEHCNKNCTERKNIVDFLIVKLSFILYLTTQE